MNTQYLEWVLSYSVAMISQVRASITIAASAPQRGQENDETLERLG
ncbi:hypothetical protein [Rugamonas apoptosis]|uniref:Uncharacterized protein n=1 Tax=Rugamonas apoptosis TaxID=2758570 RepID=A0A7W2IK82_9BURK|nr:hypothetical protein [Rugamonas apoptosis]MBA5687091.1 hypothetical protein [Rugamonas apoptosis]